MLKSTTDLLNELQDDSCSLSDYIQSHSDTFIDEDIQSFWEKLIFQSGYSKSNIINKSDFSYCYFYDVIQGKKSPTKDKVVRLILAMKLSLEQCQAALIISGRAALYPKNKRDSILIYAIDRGLTITQCNALLSKYKESELK